MAKDPVQKEQQYVQRVPVYSIDHHSRVDTAAECTVLQYQHDLTRVTMYSAPFISAFGNERDI